MTVNVIDNEEWRSFFQTYRSLTPLWNSRTKQYFNRKSREAAWNVLLEEYRNIVPDATLTALKNKVNNIRSQYRRTLRLIRKSKSKSGKGAKDVYEPTIWFFYELDFLRDDVTTNGVRSTEFSDEDERRASKRHKNVKEEKTEVRRQAIEQLKRTESDTTKDMEESEIYARSWACSFNKLSERQKLFAKKAIEEILILGQLEQLTLNCVAQPVNSFYSRTSTPASRMASPDRSFAIPIIEHSTVD